MVLLVSESGHVVCTWKVPLPSQVGHFCLHAKAELEEAKILLGQAAAQGQPM